MVANDDAPNAITATDDIAWYEESVGTKLDGPARELLENYSKIPSEQVESHVLKIREQAWQVHPYPCIGAFRFLDLALSQSPDYPHILQRLKSGQEKFLDLGCCFGQELRKVVADGAPSSQLYGADLRPEFFELGYSLFRDKATLQSHFIAADTFDTDSTAPLASLHGTIDILYAGSFLHLFNYAGQLQICQRIVRLLRPRPGSVVLGRQVGNLEAGEFVGKSDNASMYRHNVSSFERLWQEVGHLTGTRWSVKADLFLLKGDDADARGRAHGPGFRRLRFSVFRE